MQENMARRLLIVDDDTQAVEIFKGVFEGDFEVSSAYSGEEAMAILEDSVPDVVVLDAVLPGMNGWDVCRRIKAESGEHAPKVIMVSACAVDMDDRRKGYEAGADDYLVKPFIHQDLHAKVQVWSRMRATEKRLAAKVEELEQTKTELQRARDRLQHRVDLGQERLGEVNQELLSEKQKRKQREMEKNVLRSRLFESEKLRAIGQLAGGVAHDFNNLLGGIMGNADLLNIKRGDDADVAKHADRILRATRRGAKLTRQLLTFARRRVSVEEIIDMESVVDETLALLENTINKNVRIVRERASAPVRVKGDHGELATALLNLALNARDAMPEGGILTIRAERAEATDMGTEGLVGGPVVKVSVADTGTGIDKGVIDRVFEPFYTTKPTGEGAGLGLATVYGCVEQHGGKVSVESRVGAGSTFMVVLPATDEAVSATEEPRGGAAGKGTGHILLVDDEQVVRETGREMLEGLGYAVSTCSDGAEAIEYVVEHLDHIDAVVLDMIMPNISGTACYREIRKISSSVPILFTSGHTGAQPTPRAEDDPATAFLPKPFEVAAFGKALAGVLGKRA